MLATLYGAVTGDKREHLLSRTVKNRSEARTLALATPGTELIRYGRCLYTIGDMYAEKPGVIATYANTNIHNVPL